MSSSSSSSVHRHLSFLSLSLSLFITFVLSQPQSQSPSQPQMQMKRDSNGMDMSMDGAMSLASGSMLPYLHFTIGGDILWFQGWVPQGPGAMFGACVGLFLLGIVERWVAACRAVMEGFWGRRAQVAYTNKLNANASANGNDEKNKKERMVPAPTIRNTLLMRTAPPFIPAHDIVRGIMHAGQAALTFAIMLGVMTFQLGFIISLVLGLGVGEMMFGRYAHAGARGH